jgi:hypothetical protein
MQRQLTLAAALVAAFTLATAAGAHAQVVSDSFTGADGTALESHVGEVGASWTRHPNYPAIARLQSNRVWGSEWALYLASGVPPTNEYDVMADLTVRSNSGAVGLVARASTTGPDSFYLARYNQSRGMWQMVKCTPTECIPQGSTTMALTVGATYSLRLEVRNAAKRLYVNGILRASSFDNEYTQVGRAGIRSGPGIVSATGGYHLDNFRVAVPSADTTITAGPSGSTIDATPTFSFASVPSGGTFECRLDGPGAAIGTWAACTNPKTYGTLLDGSYTFRVRATVGGLTDSTPATRSFSVAAPPAYTTTFQDSFEGLTFPQVFAMGAWCGDCGVAANGKHLDGPGAYFNQVTPVGYVAAQGTKVAEAGLTSTSTRAEIQCHRYVTPDPRCAGGEGTEWVYEWSFRIPSDVAIPDQPHDRRPNIMQTKTAGPVGCYGGGLVVRRNADPGKFDLRQSIRGGTITDPNGGCTMDLPEVSVPLGTFTKGAWHRVILHARWSSNPSIGFERMWIDGVEVMPKQTRATLIAGATSQMFRLGLYNSINDQPAGNTNNWRVQYDDVRIGIP